MRGYHAGAVLIIKLGLTLLLYIATALATGWKKLKR